MDREEESQGRIKEEETQEERIKERKGDHMEEESFPVGRSF
jgi:hypothetical protein